MTRVQNIRGIVIRLFDMKILMRISMNISTYVSPHEPGNDREKTKYEDK